MNLDIPDSLLPLVQVLIIREHYELRKRLTKKLSKSDRQIIEANRDQIEMLFPIFNVDESEVLVIPEKKDRPLSC